MKAERQTTNGEWLTVKLSDVAQQCLGKMLDAKKNKGHRFPYLRNPNVRWFDVDTTDLQTMPFEDHELERYGLRAGDIVICEGGEAGRAAIWDGRLADVKFQKAIHRVRPGPRLYNRFFVHRLMADYYSGRLADYFTGTTIKHFTGQDLARYEFPLPPLAEQRRIAEVLDRAEALRAKRRAALAELDSLTQSIFLDMFGPNGKHHSSCSTAFLGSLCRSINDGVHKTPTYIESGVPFVTVKNIVNGALDLTTTKFISEEDHRAFTKRTKPEPGDVLVSKDGTIGVPCPITTDDEFSIFVSVALIKPKRELIDQLFLVAQFQSDWVQRQIRAESKGIAIRHLHLEDFRRLVFIVSPIELQREFARRVRAVEKLKTAQRASLAELDALFASLQQRAFRGEL